MRARAHITLLLGAGQKCGMPKTPGHVLWGMDMLLRHLPLPAPGSPFGELVGVCASCLFSLAALPGPGGGLGLGTGLVKEALWAPGWVQGLGTWETLALGAAWPAAWLLLLEHWQDGDPGHRGQPTSQWHPSWDGCGICSDGMGWGAPVDQSSAHTCARAWKSPRRLNFEPSAFLGWGWPREIPEGPSWLCETSTLLHGAAHWLCAPLCRLRPTPATCSHTLHGVGLDPTAHPSTPFPFPLSVLL